MSWPWLTSPTRLEIWTLFEGWKDLPSEVRRALGDWQLARYIDGKREQIERLKAGERLSWQLENADICCFAKPRRSWRGPPMSTCRRATAGPRWEVAASRRSSASFRERPRPGRGDLTRAGTRRVARRRPPWAHAHRRGGAAADDSPRPPARSATAAPTAAFRSSPARAWRGPALAALALRRPARSADLHALRTLRAPLPVRRVYGRARWARSARRRAAAPQCRLPGGPLPRLWAVRHGLPRGGHHHGGARRRRDRVILVP